MAFNADGTLSEVQALLNDPQGNTYNNTKCLPFLRRAYEELQSTFHVAEVPALLVRSAPITVAAGAVTVVLPTDLILPIWLEERPSGGSDLDWVPMLPKMWEPTIAQSSYLVYWVWREEKIYLLGATVNHEVRIHYLKSLGTIKDQNDDVAITNANSFLAAKTASLIARVIKRDRQLAEDLNMEAGAALNRLVALATKGMQQLPVHRIPFGTSRHLYKRRLF
jgi:hypothetical protein